MNTTQLALGGAAVAAAVLLTQDGGIDGLLGGSEGSGTADGGKSGGAAVAPAGAGQNTGPMNIPSTTAPAPDRPDQPDFEVAEPTEPSGGSSGGSQKTLRPEFRDFRPEIKAEIRELPDAKRERLPGANSRPLSPSALDYMIGQGDNVPFSRDEAFARPGEDPVEVVREHFRSEAIKSGRIPLQL